MGTYLPALWISYLTSWVDPPRVYHVYHNGGAPREHDKPLDLRPVLWVKPPLSCLFSKWTELNIFAVKPLVLYSIMYNIHIYIDIHTLTYIHWHTYIDIHTLAYIHWHAYIDIHWHTYIHTYIHSCIHTYIHIYIYNIYTCVVHCMKSPLEKKNDLWGNRRRQRPCDLWQLGSCAQLGSGGALRAGCGLVGMTCHPTWHGKIMGKHDEISYN